MMKNRTFVAILTPLALATWVGTTTPVLGGGYSGYYSHRYQHFSADLDGYSEVPSISTVARGRFKAKLDAASEEIKYELSYYDFSSKLCQVHIHFGEKHTNGDISVWICGTDQGELCSGLPVPPDGVEPCPTDGSSVSGTIVPDDVIGPSAQGIEQGEFDELVDAMKAGATYVNAHTADYRGGEIRGQIKAKKGRHYYRYYRH